MTFKKIFQIIIFLILSSLFNADVFAAAPFLTNDPEPLPYKNWKLYVFSSTDHSSVSTTTNIPGLQFKVGAAKDLELQAIISEINYGTSKGYSAYGYGDTVIVLKYRFIHETEYLPQVAFHPFLEFPTGDRRQHLGNGRFWTKIPIFFQKSWGSWKTYGGGGYGFNSAPGKRNYPYGGWLLQKNLTDHFILGGELFSQGRSAHNIPAFTILNVGSTYQLTSRLTALGSIGHNILGQRNTVAYLGISLAGCF